MAHIQEQIANWTSNTNEEKQKLIAYRIITTSISISGLYIIHILRTFNVLKMPLTGMIDNFSYSEKKDLVHLFCKKAFSRFLCLLCVFFTLIAYVRLPALWCLSTCYSFTFWNGDGKNSL